MLQRRLILPIWELHLTTETFLSEMSLKPDNPVKDIIWTFPNNPNFWYKNMNRDNYIYHMWYIPLVKNHNHYFLGKLVISVKINSSKHIDSYTVLCISVLI